MMPFTVITLKNSTPSLRGDLSKWMQEIATGVYVGNFNSRIREKIWERVQNSVGNGEATISFAYQNEIGYHFKTHNTKRMVIDSDGIPLVKIPVEKSEKENDEIKKGFSKAAKFHQARVYSGKKPAKQQAKVYTVLDIETDGVNFQDNAIIEIGAIKCTDNHVHEFHALISRDGKLPKEIVDLTGISDALLEQKGIALEEALMSFREFIQNTVLVGYNIKFDLGFLNRALKKHQMPSLTNKSIDLMQLVKKEKKFLNSYQLSNVLKDYGIIEEVPHRALEDAKLILKLALKVNKFRDLIQEG